MDYRYMWRTFMVLEEKFPKTTQKFCCGNEVPAVEPPFEE